MWQRGLFRSWKVCSSFGVSKAGRLVARHILGAPSQRSHDSNTCPRGFGSGTGIGAAVLKAASSDASAASCSLVGFQLTVLEQSIKEWLREPHFEQRVIFIS